MPRPKGSDAKFYKSQTSTVTPIKLHFILFDWNTMREIIFLTKRKEVWIRNVNHYILKKLPFLDLFPLKKFERN